jgi:hypothetical protein
MLGMGVGMVKVEVGVLMRVGLLTWLGVVVCAIAVVRSVLVRLLGGAGVGEAGAVIVPWKERALFSSVGLDMVGARLSVLLLMLAMLNVGVAWSTKMSSPWEETTTALGNLGDAPEACCLAS